MSLTKKGVEGTMGSEDTEAYAIAKEILFRLQECLNLRKVKDDNMTPHGPNIIKPTMKDPNVAVTKGAPKKGKEQAKGSQNIGRKRRCCTKCGNEGHTKRTCVRSGDETINSCEGGNSNTFSETSTPTVLHQHHHHSINIETTAEASPRDWSNKIGGAGMQVGSDRGKGHPSTINNSSRGNNPAIPPPGGTIFLGGQNIHQFYSAQSFTLPTAAPVLMLSTPAGPSQGTKQSEAPSFPIGNELQQWILEQMAGVTQSRKRP